MVPEVAKLVERVNQRVLPSEAIEVDHDAGE